MRRILIALLAVMLSSTPVIALEDEGDLNITILYDNYPFKEGLVTGWGFSCIVEGTEKTVLFDIGSGIVPANMEKLEISPESVDIVVFSHNHSDHTAGTLVFLRENSDVTVYMPQSFPQSFKNSVTNAGAEVVDVQKPVKICEKIYSTGELTTGVREQGLAIKTARGLVVITGCAHPGIVNMIKAAKEACQEDDVYLVLGGFHLLEMGSQQIKNIITQFREENVEKVAPTHCTGDLAINLFKQEYGDDFISLGVGKEIEIEGAFPELQGTAVDLITEWALWAQVKTEP
jgi:7,8-dihydropterin-6-yl-methyl-4-(beta-D-ribofuranosyl)aminobenzene 5'-phosphate synthase